MHAFTVLIIVCQILIVLGEKRCYECTDHPSPSDCRNIITCPDDYECHVSQFVTSGGLVLYNSGCHSTQRCQQLSGRRSDLTVCEECCTGDLCNNAGCGVTAPARPDRGLICFSCDSQADQSSCRKVTVCDKEEFCSIKYDVKLQHYVTQCMSTNQCTALQSIPHLVGKRSTSSADVCFACCDSDYCNDNCTKGKPVATSSSWSEWSAWTSCSVTCGQGQGQRLRTRTCQDGNDCIGSSSATATCTASGSCDPTVLTTDDPTVYTTAVPVVTWLPWGAWTTCSSTCGQGQRFRMRNCNDGQTCVGDGTMMETCTSPTICSQTTVTTSISLWTQWSSWSTCSKTCGSGTKLRHRACISGPCTDAKSEYLHCSTNITCSTHSHYFTEAQCTSQKFDPVKVEGHVVCLKLLYESLTWDEARQRCHNLGAELYTAENSQRQEALKTYLSNLHAFGLPYIWLGLRAYHPHQWLWAGKPSFLLTNYNNFHDSKMLGETGCASFNMTRNSSWWYRNNCTPLHDAVCELQTIN